MLSSSDAIVRLVVATTCAVMLTCAAARAQGTPAPAPDDPVVATVDGKPIHLSDLKDAVQLLPENMRSLPPQALYPMLLDQMIDARALVTEAHKSGLDKDPTVQRQVTAAEDRALQTAVLSKEVGPTVTDAAVHARYDQDIAGKTGEEEVHAKHILVEIRISHCDGHVLNLAGKNLGGRMVPQKVGSRLIGVKRRRRG